MNYKGMDIQLSPQKRPLLTVKRLGLAFGTP